MEDLSKRLAISMKNGVSEYNIDGNTTAAVTGKKTQEVEQLNASLKSFVVSRAAGSNLLDASETIRKLLIKNSYEGNYTQPAYFTIILKGLKRVPVTKAERTKKESLYYPTEESKKTAPYVEWTQFAELMKAIEEDKSMTGFRLSAASLVIALEPIVLGMCEAGLQNPKERGWLILNKGPYHFLTYGKLIEYTKPWLENALERIFSVFAVGDLGKLIIFNKNARPSRRASETLGKIKDGAEDTTIEKFRNAFIFSPGYWRWASDIRKPVGNGRMDQKDFDSAWETIIEYCELIVYIGTKFNSPGMKEVTKGPDMSAAKFLFARVAAICADIHFVIAYMKTPKGLSKVDRAIKTMDDAMYAQIMGTEEAKTKMAKKVQGLADVMYGKLRVESSKSETKKP